MSKRPISLLFSVGLRMPQAQTLCITLSSFTSVFISIQIPFRFLFTSFLFFVGLCGRPQLHKICTQTHNKVKYAKWKANCLGRGPSFGWGCGKAPKSIFQLSYHLELFSRAHTHTQRDKHTNPYTNTTESSA